jgi:HEAT repeat protein
MRKPVVTAFLALLLLPGCERSFQDEATYEGVTTSQWIELLTDDDVEKRRKAAFVLGELGLTEADETVPPLAQACSDPDVNVRLIALKSLEKLAPKAKKAQGAVGRAMNDKNKTVLKQAIKTFKAIEMAKPSALNGGA